MTRFCRKRRLKNLLLACLALGFFLCYLSTTNSSENKEPLLSSDRPRRLVEKYSINCSAIYNMEPSEVGKSLEIRKRKIYSYPSDEAMVNASSDCDWFLASNGYDAIHASQMEQDFPLAYSLVVHKEAAQVERLLRAIYKPQNVYCIHYDLKSSLEFISAMRGLAHCVPNVFVASKLERVQYASITRLRADLNCLDDLLESKVKWKYAINLCGQDFPLKTNAELVSDLKKLNGANMVESKRPGEKKQRWTHRYVLKNDQSQFHKSPVITSQKKAPPPHSIEMFVGSAYFTLSREFVLFVHWSPLVQGFLAWSEETFSPDEHFWATLIRVPGVPGEVSRSDPEVSELTCKTRLVKWSYLEDKLYPQCTGDHVRSVCIYGAAELRWLLNQGHWFANKVDPKVDPVLVECLEENIFKESLRTNVKRSF